MTLLKPEKFQLMAFLSQGILPFEQWSCVFANPELDSRPGLICKAFTVWFPTMLDYLQRPAAIEAILVKLEKDAEAQEALALSRELEVHYRKLLSLFSREEQFFINDRRLQNVHGILSIFRPGPIRVKHYNKASGKVVDDHIDNDSYHGIMRTFYPTMQASEVALRNRLVTSDAFRELGVFYNNNLKAEPCLIEIATRLGVFAR